ncbi:MAG: SCO family protein [Nocardioides sp.]|uniref:SCO family protein n=1 Tax=Nocardioides sp. TaxID=35761 RepID=UPI003F02FB5A
MADLRRWVAAAAALASVAVLAACGEEEAEPAAFTGTVLDTPFEVDPTPLVGPDGSPFSLTGDTDKRLTIVFYGYTNCPDICGQVMSTLATTMTRLDDAEREQLDVVFVTTDPARDTTDVVNEYVTRYDPSFVGVTGDLDDIITVGRSMGVGIDQGEKLASGGYDITHGTRVYALDGDDKAPVMWSEQVSQTELATDIHTLLQED